VELKKMSRSPEAAAAANKGNRMAMNPPIEMMPYVSKYDESQLTDKILNDLLFWTLPEKKMRFRHPLVRSLRDASKNVRTTPAAIDVNEAVLRLLDVIRYLEAVPFNRKPIPGRLGASATALVVEVAGFLGASQQQISQAFVPGVSSVPDAMEVAP
jgi:hypothetical protein